MYGFEFASRKKTGIFPKYDIGQAVSPEALERIAPLVWQEHCVECAMPLCYSSCAHYRKRADGRCRRFKYGIEKFRRNGSILDENVVINMNEWAKLETFFFTAGFSYKNVYIISKCLDVPAFIAQISPFGKVKRFCYYIKEYFTRKIGYLEENIPYFLLFEIFNDSAVFNIILENRADEEIVFRRSLLINQGYNRYWIPSEELNYKRERLNNLCLYPDGSGPCILNIISLELVTIKSDYMRRYFPESDKKVKCVVWDLDNTLWNGVIAEDGEEGIQLNHEIVNIIKRLDEKGIINCIASKNDQERTCGILKQMGISEYFVCSMVNWNPKSENIKKIAKILDIGLDTFVFVDDSAYELSEVRVNCPGIRVCDAHEITDYVKKEFFNVPVTKESKSRRRSYQEIMIRNRAALESNDDITDFLISCRMKVHIAHPRPDELERCYELVQRTNQLNLSAKRLTMEEIEDSVRSDRYDAYRIKVDDRYGDYGLVGFALFDISNGESAVLEHFVFSCRAARKRIEENFFKYMILKYKSLGFKSLDLICKRTEKNQLMQQVLSESGLFRKTDKGGGEFQLHTDLSKDFGEVQIVEIVEE